MSEMSEESGSTIVAPRGRQRRSGGDLPLELALALLWSAREPQRAGEVALLDGATAHVLGRHKEGHEHHGMRPLRWRRQRPGREELRPPLDLARTISKRQVGLWLEGADRLRVLPAGKARVRVQGSRCPTEGALAGPGDTIVVGDQLVLLVLLRPPKLPRLRFYPSSSPHAFGLPDPDGIVGESPAAWTLRDRLAYIARLTQHVIVTGASGSGKEAAAQAIHRLSARRRHHLVTHSAANFPANLIEAELFGNRQDYPNPGTPGRKGLIGEADGSTLFLDEIGELPKDMQARLLRVLDQKGEYRGLGFDGPSRSDFRLVSATNQPLDTLREEIRARHRLEVSVPGLEARREDIPLLAVHLLRRLARAPETAALLDPLVVEPRGPVPWFRISMELMESLVRHPYGTHVRELDKLLLASLGESPGDTLVAGEQTRALLRTAPAPPVGPAADITRDQLVDALDQHRGNLAQVQRALGLGKDQLYRLRKKHGQI